MVGFLISIPALASTSILRSGLLEHLITRRSLVQIRPLHPKKCLGFLSKTFFVVCKCRSFGAPADLRVSWARRRANNLFFADRFRWKMKGGKKGTAVAFLRVKCASKKKRVPQPAKTQIVFWSDLARGKIWSLSFKSGPYTHEKRQISTKKSVFF